METVVEFKFYEPRPILYWYTQQLKLFEVLMKISQAKNASARFIIFLIFGPL